MSNLVKLGTFSASNDEKLRLYGYFKVSNEESSSTTSSNSMINHAKERALSDAKKECITSDNAKLKYIELVKKLIIDSLDD